MSVATTRNLGAAGATRELGRLAEDGARVYVAAPASLQRGDPAGFALRLERLRGMLPTGAELVLPNEDSAVLRARRTGRQPGDPRGVLVVFTAEDHSLGRSSAWELRTWTERGLPVFALRGDTLRRGSELRFRPLPLATRTPARFGLLKRLPSTNVAGSRPATARAWPGAIDPLGDVPRGMPAAAALRALVAGGCHLHAADVPASEEAWEALEELARSLPPRTLVVPGDAPPPGCRGALGPSEVRSERPGSDRAAVLIVLEPGGWLSERAAREALWWDRIGAPVVVLETSGRIGWRTGFGLVPLPPSERTPERFGRLARADEPATGSAAG